MSEQNNKSELTRIGSRACGIACAFLGVVLALLLLYAGFWRTLFVALMAALGYFFGRVSDKKTFVRDTVNRVIPEKNQPEPPVANAERARKIMEEMKSAGEAAEETVEETAEEAAEAVEEAVETVTKETKDE